MTTDTILVFNAGSATLKFGRYRFANIGASGERLSRAQVDLSPGSHGDAVRLALATLDHAVERYEITAVGHRVVHGGADYVSTVAIDARGAHQPIIRQRVCDALAWLGIDCNSARNVAGETQFDSGCGRVTLWNIPTDEESVIARRTGRALGAQ